MSFMTYQSRIVISASPEAVARFAEVADPADENQQPGSESENAILVCSGLGVQVGAKVADLALDTRLGYESPLGVFEVRHREDEVFPQDWRVVEILEN